jgi:hypothetical protein
VIALAGPLLLGCAKEEGNVSRCEAGHLGCGVPTEWWMVRSALWPEELVLGRYDYKLVEESARELRSNIRRNLPREKRKNHKENWELSKPGRKREGTLFYETFCHDGTLKLVLRHRNKESWQGTFVGG